MTHCLVLGLFFLCVCVVCFFGSTCVVLPPPLPLSFTVNCGGIRVPYIYFMQIITDKLSHHTGSQIDHVFLRLTIIQLSFRKR